MPNVELGTVAVSQPRGLPGEHAVDTVMSSTRSKIGWFCVWRNHRGQPAEERGYHYDQIAAGRARRRSRDAPGLRHHAPWYIGLQDL